MPSLFKTSWPGQNCSSVPEVCQISVEQREVCWQHGEATGPVPVCVEMPACVLRRRELCSHRSPILSPCVAKYRVTSARAWGLRFVLEVGGVALSSS